MGGVDDVTTSFHDVPPVVAASVLRGRGISPMEGTSVASNSLMAVLRCSGGWKGALGSSSQEELYDVCVNNQTETNHTHTKCFTIHKRNTQLYNQDAHHCNNNRVGSIFVFQGLSGIQADHRLVLW